MKKIFKKIIVYSLLVYSSLNLLANDITTLDELKITEHKFKTINEMTEIFEENINNNINLKYKCGDLFRKFKTLEEYKKRSSENSIFFNDVFVLYNDYYDNNKPSFFGVSYIAITKTSKNNCDVVIKDNDYSSSFEKQKMKLYPNITTTIELFNIYFDDLIKNIDIKNETKIDYVAMYNIYRIFKDDIEIKNFMKNNLNDGSFTYNKKLLLRGMVDENYKIILKQQKIDKLEENKKITSKQEVLEKLEKSIDEENKSKIKDSYEVYPFVY